MSADDLAKRVSFEALGAGVLTRHDAAWIEQVDSVIGHVWNEQLETTRHFRWFTALQGQLLVPFRLPS
jgi:hypothetical protein